MKAVVVSEFGGPERLRLGEAPDPVAGPGQVRVAVHAAGVNPVDAGNRADGSWAGLRAACILGYDIAGVIDSIGPGRRSGSRAIPHCPDAAGEDAELAGGAGGPRAAPPAPPSFPAAAAPPLAAG